MKTILRWTSIILFVLLSSFLIWFGWLYASVEEPLWFHDAAVPDHAKEAVRPLYFALMNLVGGSSMGLGLLGIFVALTSLRQGAKGAGAALAVALIIPVVMAAITAEELAAATGSPTSWHIMGVLLLVALIAYAAYAGAGSGRRR
jgi:hypothetical protein